MKVESTFNGTWAMGRQLLYISFSALASLASTLPAFADHPVRTEPVGVLANTVTLSLASTVLERTAEEKGSIDKIKDYHLSVSIPERVVPDLSIGSHVRVILPVVRHSEASAQVTSISEGKIELLLPHQVQQLEGQQPRVEIPLKSNGLYQVPFQAIYAPRGVTTEVFVVSDDSKAYLVPVKVLQILDNGNVVVSSKDLNGVQVVVEGNDKLLSGDEVTKLSTQKESRHD